MEENWKDIANKYIAWQHDVMTSKIKVEDSSKLWVFSWLEENYIPPVQKQETKEKCTHRYFDIDGYCHKCRIKMDDLGRHEKEKDKLKFIEIIFGELQTSNGSDTGSVHIARNYLKELIQNK